MRDIALAFAHVGTVLFTVGATIVYAIEAWMAPFAPALYFCAFEIIAIVAMGSYWFFTTRNDLSVGVGTEGYSAETLGFRRLTEVTGQIVFAFSAVLFLLTWAIPQVRVMLINRTDPARIKLHYALDDPSDDVVAAACGRIMDIGVANSATILFERLQTRPHAVKKCLESRTNRLGASMLAQRLNARWLNELNTANNYTADVRCEALEAVAVLSKQFDNPVAFELSECALHAENERARTCCAETIGSNFSLRPMRVPASYAELFRVSFFPASPEDEHRARVLGFDSDLNQRAIVNLACEHYGRQDADYYDQFLQFSEHRTCHLNVGQKTAIVTSPNMPLFCEQFSAHPELPTPVAACKSFAESTVLTAALEAKQRLKIARLSYFRNSDANYIKRGVDAVKRSGQSPKKSKADETFLALSAREGLGARTWLDGPCFQNIFDSESLIYTKQVSDCETYDPEAKVGDLVRDTENRRRENNAVIGNPNGPEARKQNAALRRARRKSSRLVKKYRKANR